MYVRVHYYNLLHSTMNVENCVQFYYHPVPHVESRKRSSVEDVVAEGWT